MFPAFVYIFSLLDLSLVALCLFFGFVIFIDETVADIAEEYFLPEYNMSREAKYDFLEKNHQLDNIFTPRDNRNYSYQAYQFGYPKNNYDEALKSSDNDE